MSILSSTRHRVLDIVYSTSSTRYKRDELAVGSSAQSRQARLSFRPKHAVRSGEILSLRYSKDFSISLRFSRNDTRFYRFFAGKTIMRLRRILPGAVIFLLAMSCSFSRLAPRADAQSSSRTTRSAAEKRQVEKRQIAKRQAAAKRAQAARQPQGAVQKINSQWKKVRPALWRNRVPLMGGAALLLVLGIALQGFARRKKSDETPHSQWQAGEDEELIRLRSLLEFERTRQRELEDLYWKMAMNASDVLYIMHPTEGTIDWFGQIDTMLGYKQNSFPRTVEAWAESIHPDESEVTIELYTHSCKSGDEFRVEYRMRHRNGGYRDWLHRGRPMFDANGNLKSFIGACTDVTERNRSQKRVRESEERLSRILETNADAVVMCDQKGVITFVNRAAEMLFGSGRETLLKSTYNAGPWKIISVSGEELSTTAMPFARVLEARAAVSDIEHAIEQPSGKVVVVSVNAAPLHDSKGEFSGAVLSITDVTGRKALEERLSWQAFHDALTGLPNRALFMDRLTHALIRSSRAQVSVAVFFIDLDNFKNTNDTLGHDAGDDLLKTTANRLLEALRASDTAARLGGDEFVLLLENIPEASHAKIVADRVLESLLQPVMLKGQAVIAPPSIGVAISTMDSTPESLMKQADEAMYRAKQNGKARYEFHGCEDISQIESLMKPPLRIVG